MKVCSVAGCGRVELALGLCNPHYIRLKRHGDPLGGSSMRPTRRLAIATCSVDGCAEPAKRKGLCNTHLQRATKFGDPVAGHRPKYRRRGDALRFISEVAVPFVGDECLIWPFNCNTKGYAVIQIDGKKHPVPQVVCEEVHGQAPSPDHEAAHSCGNGDKGCINPNHLRWATHVENMADRVQHGTMAWGGRHGMAKLTEADVLLLRSLSPLPSYEELAGRFGVSRWTIKSIVRGYTWKHLLPSR